MAHTASSDTHAQPDERRADPLAQLREGFQILDFDWRYVYLNPVAACHGRHTPEQLIGRTMMEMYPGIEHTTLFRRLRRCMLERSTEVFENRFTYPDQSTRWFEIRVQPVPEGICVYSRDIEQRKADELAAVDREAAVEARVAALWQLWRSWSGGSI
jgi:two-component system, sensor histidine kinase PdtaS